MRSKSSELKAHLNHRLGKTILNQASPVWNNEYVPFVMCNSELQLLCLLLEAKQCNTNVFCRYLS